jgi:hypothetical protein
MHGLSLLACLIPLGATSSRFRFRIAAWRAAQFKDVWQGPCGGVAREL